MVDGHDTSQHAVDLYHGKINVEDIATMKLKFKQRLNNENNGFKHPNRGQGEVLLSR